jgi:hypothetical protein
MTIAALEKEIFAFENEPRPEVDEVCCNGDPASDGLRHTVTHRFMQQFKDFQPSAELASFRTGSALGLTGRSPAGFGAIDPFSRFTLISPAQIAVANPVFGSSINYTLVFLSNISGSGGRAFTVAIGPVAVMNFSSFTPKNSDLIHELVHVWQSQHHSQSTAFMVNSVSSQALARVENEGLARLDPTLKSNPKFPSQFPRSPYACVTGRPFSEYAAEQIAKQVERNFGAAAGTPIALATDPVVAHIKGAVKGPDADNITGLKTSRTEDKRKTGVLF